MLLLIRVYDIPFLQLINTDFLCIEILQSIAGCVGILLTVPLVAAISAWLMTRRSLHRDFKGSSAAFQLQRKKG